jgi:poly(A) polymerase
MSPSDTSISPETGLPRDRPVGQLPPQPWMSAAETKVVITALTAEGADVRFVGGCVRDSVLNRPVRDIDIATHDPPERVMALLEKGGLRAIPTGIAHGTVTAAVGKAHFEITTLRCDVETFGRHARVEFTNDWTEDAARRDFTINAMFCRPDGMVFDPFDGLADLGAGRVRFVGDPMRRIDEDVLRLLRFFRFHAHYGRPPADIAALAACRSQAFKLPSLSGERVSGEIFKLLEAPDPGAVLHLMRGEQVLPHILPEANDIGRLRVLTFLESRGIVHPVVAPDPLRRLAALLPSDAAKARDVANRLKLSNHQSDRLVAMVTPDHTPDQNTDMPTARRMLHHTGTDLFRDRVLLAWAGRKAIDAHMPGDSDHWRRLLDLVETWRPVSLPVKGRDVMALGVPSGPRVGAILTDLERWWESSDFRPGRDEALEKLRSMLACET